NFGNSKPITDCSPLPPSVTGPSILARTTAHFTLYNDAAGRVIIGHPAMAIRCPLFSSCKIGRWNHVEACLLLATVGDRLSRHRHLCRRVAAYHRGARFDPVLADRRMAHGSARHAGA